MSSEKLVRGVATSGGLEGCSDFWLRVASWELADCALRGCWLRRRLESLTRSRPALPPRRILKRSEGPDPNRRRAQPTPSTILPNDDPPARHGRSQPAAATAVGLVFEPDPRGHYRRRESRLQHIHRKSNQRNADRRR